MDAPLLERLVSIRHFPPVVHPRHARELLSGGEGLAEWTAGYAITVPEHRQMLEELLGSLAWHETGQAVLINGLYGAGKSHLLVLLHLLAGLPAAWSPFLEAHPGFRRYAEPMQKHRRLIVHFSLDEFGPKMTLEEAIGQEVTRTLTTAGLALPATWGSGSRLDDWAGLLETCRGQGYDGVILLLDELSLFLAGRSPARREADAAFLQFLAGWTGRAPVWLIGALQRNLADVGMLRTHSWRQVEDRFRRYSLSPQEIGSVLRDKLIVRTEPAAVRSLVAETIAPAAAKLQIDLSPGELQTCWPFHPRTLDLFMALADGHLSPHRSAVEILQQLRSSAMMTRPADRLITLLDLLPFVLDDLRTQPRLEKVWNAVSVLHGRAKVSADPELAGQVIDLLALLHLAEHPSTVAELRLLLFDGAGAPSVNPLSEILHSLRRSGPYLTATREADAGREIVCLAIDDEIGVLADLRMQEMRQELTPDDRRIVELAWEACREPVWPLALVSEGARLPVPWSGSERQVQLITSPVVGQDTILRLYEGLAACKAEAAVLFGWPGQEGAETWHAGTASLTGDEASVLLYWQPRPLQVTEREMLTDYAAWTRAANAPLPPGSSKERRVCSRCGERAVELRSAVGDLLQCLFVEGSWLDGRGEEGLPHGDTLAECLAGMLAAGFAVRYPHFPELTAGGTPTRAAMQQLLLHFIEPGETQLDPQSLLGEYLDRFALTLGCVDIAGSLARVAPPRWEIMEALLAVAADRPVRLAEAFDALGRPPFGLTTEQARLAVFAALRVGALQPLDAFLQPLDPDQIPLTRSDAVSFLAPPMAAEARFRSLILELAAHWGIAVDPWPVACNQVERRLRSWLRSWMPRLHELRQGVAAWSEVVQASPWAWERSLRALGALEHLAGLQAPSLDELLDAWQSGGMRMVDIEALGEAVSWWRDHGKRLPLLPSTLPELVKQEADCLWQALAEGEICLPHLGSLGERLDALWQQYREAYRRWHDAAFGAEVVNELRETFDSAEFRAVKLLTRLPLPVPEPAQTCLEALAKARANYCPGFFAGVDMEGCCTKCRLPLDSPSPMPDAVAVRQLAESALHAYAGLLADDPWTESIRARLPRAPEEIATRAGVVLGWQPVAGALELLDTLDDRLLAWLCREDHPSAHRRLDSLHSRLAGHDLTLGEARELVTDWLDPEHGLGENCILRFE